MSGAAHLQVELHSRGPVPLAAQLDCQAGELVALLGPSGSGKSTVLRAIAGLHPARDLQGRVQLGAHTWLHTDQGVRLPPQQRRVGLVFQDYALFPHLTAMENVALGASGTRPGGTKEPEIRALLERLGLAALAQRRPAQLSGGQQQRVALARALMRLRDPATPGVLLLDEPFSAVDTPTRQLLYRELAAWRRDVAVPMVLVTHDLTEARRLADRVVVLDAGQTLQTGTPERVFGSPRNARVAQLVGIQNHFQGHFFKRQPGWAELSWEDGQGGLVVLQVVDKNRLDEGVAVSWVLAGEHVSVLPASAVADMDHPAPTGDNRVRCTLVELLTLGETSLCTLRPQGLRGVHITLNLPTSQVRQLGGALGVEVCVQIPAAGIHIMPQRSA